MLININLICLTGCKPQIGLSLDWLIYCIICWPFFDHSQDWLIINTLTFFGLSLDWLIINMLTYFGLSLDWLIIVYVDPFWWVLVPNSSINISNVSSFYPLQLKVFQLVRLICDRTSNGLIRHWCLEILLLAAALWFCHFFGLCHKFDETGGGVALSFDSLGLCHRIVFWPCHFGCFWP